MRRYLEALAVGRLHEAEQPRRVLELTNTALQMDVHRQSLRR